MNARNKKKAMPILVSACLLGIRCRYDDTSKPNPQVQALQKDFALIPFCPEEFAGLPTPRPPAECQADGRVINTEGEDVTDAFMRGAAQAVCLCQDFQISYAILKERSPSCGPHTRYDGSFSSTLIQAPGLTAKALTEKGITVLSEEDLLETDLIDVLA